jgi:colicin import membrane protein
LPTLVVMLTLCSPPTQGQALARLVALEEEKTAAEQQFASAMQALQEEKASAEAEAKAQAASLSTDLAAVKKECAALTQQIATMQEAHKADRGTILDMGSLRTDPASCTHAEVHQAEVASVVAAHAKDADGLRAAHADKIKSLQAQVDALKTICEEQSQDIMSDAQARSELEKNVIALRTKVQSAETALAQAQSKAKAKDEQSERDKAEVLAQLTAARHDVERMAKEQAALETVFAKDSLALSTTLSQKAQEISLLTADLEALAQAEAAAHAKLEAAVAAQEALERRLAEMEVGRTSFASVAFDI